MSAKASGRPLRFFVLLAVGWIGLRAAMLAGPTDAPHDVAPFGSIAPAALATLQPMSAQPVAAALPVGQRPPQPKPVVDPVARPASTAVKTGANKRAPAPVPAKTVEQAVVKLQTHKAMPVRSAERNKTVILATAPMRSVRVADLNHRPSVVAATPFPPVRNVPDPPIRPPVVPPVEPARPTSDRWQLGAWAFWRSGSGAAPLATQGGRLGGSQVGARIDYDLNPGGSGRLAPYARVTSALNQPASPEAALGLAYQPSRRMPISLLAERRFSLGKGGRNANALFVIGGFGPTLVAHDFYAEAYGQAGMVGFSRRDLVADGKLALLRALSGTPLSAGFSFSGGVQPGVSRLDIGPELRWRLPLGRANARLSIEWRQRIAGDAAPGSGLAFTLASDF